MASKPNPVVGVRVPPAQHAALRKAAAAQGTTVSDVVRAALSPFEFRDHEGNLCRNDGMGNITRVAPIKAAAKPAPRAAVAPRVSVDTDPEPHGFTEHRAWRARKAKAAHDAKSVVGADGLTGHERARAADMPPAQRARFVENAKAVRKRSGR